MITWQIGRAKLGQFEICWEFQHGMCYGVPFPNCESWCSGFMEWNPEKYFRESSSTTMDLNV